ncbi:MAG: hypothetical protein H8D42_01120 [Candidatus Marinimicrobia bacterium]|nr:hypothetical protein [Candidatus Neomarinimicrobiota bacterium]MBL7067098.1 hypothetical protein [Candidatus Neomarinimicrobiota bacterium]
MERETELLTRLAEYLVSHGYPEESIILEWRISRKYIVDLAVIDPKSKKAVALFELKRNKNERSVSLAKEQLKRYIDELGDIQIPLYVVFPSDTEPYFELFYIPSIKDDVVRIEQFPTFINFKTSILSKELSKTEKSRRDTLKYFRRICWILASILTVLVYLDFRDILKITAERLAIIGLIIGLIIIPFASKLKVLGLEFERFFEKE